MHSASPLSLLSLVLTMSGLARGANRVEFKRDISPILSDKCFVCHGPDKANRKTVLRFDSEEGTFIEFKDHWSAHISYACILAEEFRRESMFEVLNKRHAYSATDNFVLDLQAEADGKSYIMGDIIKSQSAPKLKIRVMGTDPPL